MKIALAQINCTPGDLDKNTDTMTRMTSEASKLGAQMVIFPEMSDTGYDMKLITKMAADWDCGPMQRLMNSAKSNSIAVVAGVAERTQDRIYNTVAVIAPNGTLVTKYRKVHLITAEPVCEQNYICPGSSFETFTVGDFRFGIMTCYDIRFPEMARTLALAGSDVIIFPAAFPLVRLPHWETLVRARAIENQIYVMAVNRVGTDAGLTFCGASACVDPYGVTLASASEVDAGLIVAEITKNRIAEVRGKLKVYQDRREEIYAKPVQASQWPT